jgi:hypothetical protein
VSSLINTKGAVFKCAPRTIAVSRSVGGLLAAEAALDHSRNLATKSETDADGRGDTDNGETEGQKCNGLIDETIHAGQDGSSINSHGAYTPFFKLLLIANLL